MFCLGSKCSGGYGSNTFLEALIKSIGIVYNTTVFLLPTRLWVLWLIEKHQITRKLSLKLSNVLSLYIIDLSVHTSSKLSPMLLKFLMFNPNKSHKEWIRTTCNILMYLLLCSLISNRDGIDLTLYCSCSQINGKLSFRINPFLYVIGSAKTCIFPKNEYWQIHQYSWEFIDTE